MIISLVGCIALWILVVAFANMNYEIAMIERDVAELKANRLAMETTQQYTNISNKFSFEYPLKWYINDNIKQDGMLLLDPDATFANRAPIQISVQSATKAKALMETIDGDKAVADESVMLGTTPAIQVMYDESGEESVGTAYFIDLDAKNTVVIEVVSGNGPADPAQMALETILKTFTIQQ